MNGIFSNTVTDHEGLKFGTGWIPPQNPVSGEQDRWGHAIIAVGYDDFGILWKIKENPIEELKELSNEVMKDLPVLDTDKWIYRIVVISLGLVILVTVVGAITLTAVHENAKIPDVMTALGSAAVGALAGLLTPTAR